MCLISHSFQLCLVIKHWEVQISVSSGFWVVLHKVLKKHQISSIFAWHWNLVQWFLRWYFLFFTCFVIFSCFVLLNKNMALKKHQRNRVYLSYTWKNILVCHLKSYEKYCHKMIKWDIMDCKNLQNCMYDSLYRYVMVN